MSRPIEDIPVIPAPEGTELEFIRFTDSDRACQCLNLGIRWFGLPIKRIVEIFDADAPVYQGMI